jgi:lipopolysaccharide heptosyltransferase II
VIFTVYSQTPFPAALCCYLAEIPRRLAHARENPYQLLTDWVAEPEPHKFVRHEVQRQLDLIASVGAMPSDRRLQVRVPRGAAARMRMRLESGGIDLGAPWIVVHPGASAPSRRYPAGQFAAAARMLASEHGCQLVFTGSSAEQSLVQSIVAASEVPALSLAGQTDLSELAALLRAATLLISNNTGPIHLAAAVGTPVVDLYALTNPQHTPWLVPHEVLFHEVPCKHCYKSICPEGHQHCLSLVPPEEVVGAALRLLSVERKELCDVHARN